MFKKRVKNQHQNENTLKEQFGTGSNVQTAFQFKNTKKSFTRKKIKQCKRIFSILNIFITGSFIQLCFLYPQMTYVNQ